MTREEANKTISNLRKAIIQKAKQGITINRILVGVDLIQVFKAFNYCVVCDYYKQQCKIYGIPVVIDYQNSTLLQIASIEEVTVEGS